MKPASRVIAKAVPRDGNYAGQFALPGMVPDLVRKNSGEPQIFYSEEAAETAACCVLVAQLKARTEDSRKAGGYTRLTPAEFGAALGEIDITPTYFAEIYGVPYQRVMKWLDGEQDIPHAVRMVLIGMSDDKSFEKMEAETRKALEQGQ